MPDEVSTDAPIPEPVPEPAPIATPEPIPDPIQPEVVIPPPPEPPTAQIPANEPIAPASEPLPPPSSPASVFSPVVHLARDLAAKARAVIQSRKKVKLDKIMEVVNAKGKITNDQVEKLLHVSDAIATRYLAQLEKEGKVKQEGKTGKSVKYSRVN